MNANLTGNGYTIEVSLPRRYRHRLYAVAVREMLEDRYIDAEVRIEEHTSPVLFVILSGENATLSDNAQIRQEVEDFLLAGPDPSSI